MTDRGVSITVSYTLSLAVATILLSVLLMSTGNIIENRQQEVYRSELQVVGQDLAADLMAVDRLAVAGADEAWLNTSVPRRIGGSSYSIEVTADASEAELVLQTTDPDVIVHVPFTNSTDVATRTVNGGTVRIHLTAGGTIEVSAG